jgi:outer membrane protein assembly factor BamB
LIHSAGIGAAGALLRRSSGGLAQEMVPGAARPDWSYTVEDTAHTYMISSDALYLTFLGVNAFPITERIDLETGELTWRQDGVDASRSFEHEGVLYAGGPGVIQAIDIATGTDIWRAAPAAEPLYCNVGGVFAGFLLVWSSHILGLPNDDVWVIEAASGSTNAGWSEKVDVASGDVMAGYMNGVWCHMELPKEGFSPFHNLFVLDLQHIAETWSDPVKIYLEGEAVIEDPVLASVTASTIVVAGEVAGEQTLTAFDRSTGAALWARPGDVDEEWLLGRMKGVSVDSLAYWDWINADTDPILRAVDPVSGEVQWETPIAQSTRSSGRVFMDEATIYVAEAASDDAGAHCIAFDRATGTEQARITFPGTSFVKGVRHNHAIVQSQYPIKYEAFALG